MSFEHAWMVGLQAYAYDVNEEGPAAVLEAADLAAANVVFLAVSYSDLITTQDPSRAPRLPHNPVRERHADEAFLRPVASRYPAGLIPPVGTDLALDGGEAYRALRVAAGGDGVAVVPWLLLLSQRVAMQAPGQSVVNVRGDLVPGWLCPNRPGTIEFVRAITDDLITQLDPPALFIDGARFPEPRVGRIADGLACFCDACYGAAGEVGLDLDVVRSELAGLMDNVERNPAGIARAVTRACSSGFRTLRAGAPRVALLEWLRFRQESVERAIRMVHDIVGGRTELWLDVWPPTYGWLLGQDLARLGGYSQWTRPFTYHRWGGGADIPGLIGSLGNSQETRQALYEAFRAFFRFPGPDSYAEFLQRGLDPAFITEETAYLAELLGDRSRPVAGLQIWHMGRPGVREALEYAIAAKPRGVILHCYGWATREELAAAGDWLRERGMAGLSSSGAATPVVPPGHSRPVSPRPLHRAGWSLP